MGFGEFNYRPSLFNIYVTFLAENGMGKLTLVEEWTSEIQITGFPRNLRKKSVAVLQTYKNRHIVKFGQGNVKNKMKRVKLKLNIINTRYILEN